MNLMPGKFNPTVFSASYHYFGNLKLNFLGKANPYCIFLRIRYFLLAVLHLFSLSLQKIKNVAEKSRADLVTSMFPAGYARLWVEEAGCYFD